MRVWAGRLRVCCTHALVIGMVYVCDASGAYLDCRSCHLDPAPDSGARDYYEYFAEPQRQHPTGVAYPQGPAQDFNLPMGQDGLVSFFDSNGNGIADIDEIQLFGYDRKIECSSCHREHGTGIPPLQPNMYLRISNSQDALCRTCHRN